MNEELDLHYGLEINRIEKELYEAAKSLVPNGNLSNLGHVYHDGHQTWIGLEPQTLLTPYAELRRLCELIRPKAGVHFVDLGAGYGRLGLVLNEYNKDIHFTGYELVKERVIEGNRVLKNWNCDRSQLYIQDLTDPGFVIPKADYYFIYDYGKVAHIRQTLKQLEVHADSFNFKVIARGKGTRSIIEHEYPWLSDVYPVIREENFSIYSMSM